MDLQRKENIGTVLLIALGCVCCGLALWGISHQKYFLTIAAQVAVAGLGIFIYLRFREDPLENLKKNLGWYYLGFALACIILRESINLIQGGNVFPATPFFLILSLSAKIAFAGGLILLCWAPDKRNVVRALIDSLTVALALLVLAWSLHLHPSIQNELIKGGSALPLTIRFILFINSLAGIFTLVGAFFYLINSQMTWRHHRGAPLVLCSYLCLLALHLLRVYSFGDYALAKHPTLSLLCINCLVIAAIILIIAALLWNEPPSHPAEFISDYSQVSFRQRLVTLWFPYSAALGVGLALAITEVRSNAQNTSDLLPVVILMIAVVSRQLLTMRDNLQLSERLTEANINLEQNVMERTRHLATLHSITSTLNSSLDRASVLKIALEQVIDVTNAEQGAIWLRQHKNTQAPERTQWNLAYAKGFPTQRHEDALRNLAVEMAEEHNHFSGNPQKIFEQTYGFSAHSGRILIVPIRSGGLLLGAQALILKNEEYNYETRSVVESVALELGTALQNARLYQEARQRADRDGVTDLYNHRSIQEQLATLLRHSRQHEEQFSVLMMDLNDFKYFNDTYGHPVGDDVLRTVAMQLEKICGNNNPVGRYGGDEFIILLPGQDHQQTYKTYQTLLATLEKEHFEVAPGVRIPISMSYGWAVFPEDGQTALDLITIADANLYRYKQRGEFEDENSATNNRRTASADRSTAFGVLDALITAIDNKDHYTRKHSDEVAQYALLIAQELGYSAESQRAVRISALLHDVGKIAVPDDILRHPGKLSHGDWEIMKQHPSFGALIVKDLPYLEDVISGIRYHHERWDGRGYPEGLAGTEIPIMGRLLAVPDAYSALTTNRPYRKGLSTEEALFEIERSIRTQFDPLIAKTFIEIMERQLELKGKGIDAAEELAV
jgi:diguanylate cyclase (GGDEF)-like protein/putative nucleotidyltransferase with HDIG domain